MKELRKANLAIIGASYLQLPLIEKAKEMGYTTHVFAWAADDVGEEAADVFYPISITEVEDIAEKCSKIGICGICGIATDLGNFTVNFVADKLGLPGNGRDCTLKSTNKRLMRKTFEEYGDPSPRSVLVESVSDLSSLRLHYPVIVKPTDRSGSRAISKLDSPVGLHAAVVRALEASFERKALVEEYVEGKEYSVEGISYSGRHRILAITQKRTTGAPNFIETGHLEPAQLTSEVRQQVMKVVTHALDSLGVKNGASHSELKIDDKGRISIIEIGSRMGGDCIGSDLVYYSTGIDYVRAVIQVACGEDPDLNPKFEGIEVESKFILTKDDLREFERMQSEEPERILKIADGVRLDLVGKAVDSSSRAGCYIVKR